MEIFLKEWISLIESKSGERGIFNRSAAVRKAKKYGRRDWEGYEYGVNPCGEILLRSNEFCNLSEVVIRPEDTGADVLRKLRLATILGTLQSTLTNFKYLRKVWKRNCEEERLLGVSLTGICDNPFFANPSPELEAFLNEARERVGAINSEWASYLGISPSVASTCVKPSGTVGLLVDASSGIHARYSEFFIRRVRNDRKDPLTKMMIDLGIPYEQDKVSPGSMVFQFPIRSPKGAIFRDDKTATQQLELYLTYSEFWTEHNPSITVSVKESEWLEVGAFVYKNFDKMNGVSFLPYADSVYDQAPYEEIDEATFLALDAAFPKDVDWSALSRYEAEDNSKASLEPACSAGGCDLEAIMKQG
jgi:ribonucleoside-diphosphate reductase alpha chain